MIFAAVLYGYSTLTASVTGFLSTALIESTCGRAHSMKTTEFRKMSIGARLTMAVLCWFAVQIACSAIVWITRSYTMFKCGAYLEYLGSPIVATIVVVTTLRHYPSSRLFLKGLVAVILVATVLAGGFFHCATIASHEGLLKAIELAANTPSFTSSYSPSSSSLTQLPMSTFDSMFAFLVSMMFSPWTPLARYVPIGFLLGFAAMPWPYLLLLMLITPHFLAMPIFWLLVVLSVLYTVPRQAWVWMKAAAVRVYSGTKESRNW